MTRVTRTSRTHLRNLFASALLAGSCMTATAAEHRFDLLLDTDNSAATGCSISEPAGNIAGIEQVTSIYVDTTTTTATVNRITHSTCAQGALGTETVVDASGWNVGLGHGIGGVAVIEAYVERNLLPATGSMRVVVASSSNGQGDVAPAFTLALGDAALPPAIAPAIPVPLARWLSAALALLVSLGTLWWHRRHPQPTALFTLAVLCGVSTLAWAATVVLDGNVTDWAGVSASASDPRGDAPIDTDIVAVYAQRDAAKIYFRIDADVQLDVAASIGPAFAPIADRTVAVGVHYQQVLVANSDAPGALVYALPTAPGGAALAPSPLVDWTPTAAQLGVNTFTATVTDTANRSATTTFHVNVVFVDHPPLLGAQPDTTLPAGTAFGRTLTATDPDAGDTLAFTLVAGPPGLTLAGTTLAWDTASIAPGTYAVTVKVTDASGQFDTRTFNVRVTAAAPSPTAIDDHYSVRVGETLAVVAPGVLANDVDPAGGSLVAHPLTDPAKGILNAFNADGSFNYTAPSVPAGAPFLPVLKWNNGVQYVDGDATPVVADVFANGKPVIFTSRAGINQGGVTAIDGTTGTTLWTVAGELPAPNAGCFIPWDFNPQNQTADGYAVGDIDDSGLPALVTMAYCNTDGAQGTRMIALDARSGAVRWLTPPLGALVPGLDGVHFNMTYGVTPAIARLRPNQTPSVLFKVDAEGYLDAAHTVLRCDQFKANSGLPQCTGVLVLDGADGSVRQRMVAPMDNAGGGNRASGHLMVAALFSAGTPNVIANGAVWDVDGNLLSNRLGAAARSIALAKLDDSGQLSIISYEVGGLYSAFIVARHADGTVLWQTPIDTTTVHGLLSVADLDGDGSPDIMATAEGNLYVYDARGQVKWTHRYANAANSRTIDEGKRPAAFDLDGDGIAEVIVPSISGLEFNDGKTGKTKVIVPWPDLGVTNEPAFDNGLRINAIVADIDGSGHASIVVMFPSHYYGATNYVVAVKSANNDWRPAPTVFNQFAYHVANVDNIGHIPLVEADNFAVPRTNVFGTQAQAQAPVDPRVFQATSFTYAAANGTLSSQPATVAIDLRPSNSPPAFTAIAPTGYVPYAFTYAAHATDPDPGDTVTYSLSLVIGNGATSCSVNGYSGLVTCINLFEGDQYFTLVATDSQGEAAYQTVHMVQSTGFASVPAIVGDLHADAAATLAAAGFTLGTVNAINSSYPAGQVLSQVPAAGTSAVLGEAVTVTESSGPAPAVVPFVVGELLPLATTHLAGPGFTVLVMLVPSTTAPAGQVTAQSPAGGTLLKPIAGNPVTLTVSAGDQPSLANLAGMNVAPGAAARRVGEGVTFAANGVYANGSSAVFTYAVTWTSSAPNVATVDAVGNAHAVGPGTTTITATRGAFSGQATLNVVTRTPGDVASPVALISFPADGATVTAPVSVTGTATDANFLRYELAVALAGDTVWTTLAEGAAAVSNGALGTLDPTILTNDLYTLRLTVFDRNGNQTVVLRSVQVSGNAKAGLFTLAYQDLNVPVGGIPITVTRTYDSRDKSQGDFGVGWRLGLNTLRLRTNRIPGTGWQRVQSGATIALNPTSEHKVSVTLADGKVEEFDLVLSPTSAIGALDATVVTGYAPRLGTLGKLTALGNANLLVLSSDEGDELVDDSTLATFNPAVYRYTSLDGTLIDIDRTQGVKAVTDRNGNSVTFSATGIVHSSGKSVAFTRDPQGRITEVTDPSGNVQSYAYDGNGDLVAHASATGDVTRYRYDGRHALVDIVDPLGNHAVRNDYDTAGHLVATTDASGHAVTYSINLDAQSETITDRLGNVSQYQYDAQGNVTASQRSVTIEGALVPVTSTATYDTQNNQTSQVDADGLLSTATFAGALMLTQAVDPAGKNLSTNFTYNAANSVIAATDPSGATYALSYDTSGNVIGINTPGTGAAIATVNGQGLATQGVDATGTRSVLTLDAAGNVIREDILSSTSILLRRTDSTWDANGNKASETLYRTSNGVVTPLTTRYAYDAANRLVQVTDAAGGVQGTEYDANGKVTATVDALGRRTRFHFDELGRSDQVIYPDGTVESVTYDANGNVATSTDASGHVTLYSYDELGRRVKTTLADGSSTQTVYSAGARVMAEIDANGNRTDYAYDSAGRRTDVTLPAVVNGPGGGMARPHLSTTLDARGAPVTSTDGNGHVTSIAYDITGRPVQTTYADGTITTQAFDAIGHRTSITNEEGQGTNFTYDGLGRVTTVSGLGGDATYTYDEAGNLIAQTDALAHTTRFSYDVLNRLVGKTYPGGETETRVYDAVGNVLSSTRGDGSTTAYLYDDMNRLVREVRPDGSSVAYAYTADDQRATVSDSRGVTRFSYDSTGRLASVAHPTGDTVSYAHDANGNLTSLAAPAASLSYGYDALNRLSQVSAPEGNSQLFYDLSGNRLRQAAANGLVSDAAYDPRNRPVALTHKQGSTTLLSYASVFSPAGRRSRVTELDGSVETYGYDSKGRLATETRTGSNAHTISHAYDAVSNRLRTINNGTPSTFSYDADDHLLSDGTSTYEWNANGDMVRSTRGANVTQYGYDAEDRLVSIAGNGLVNQYVYDADGNRVQATTPEGTTRFLVDSENNSRLAQVLEERDGGGALQARYSYGTELLAMTRGTTSSFHVHDPFGSTRALADSTAALTDRYQYDAYGNAISAVGSTINPYRYRGERLDADSGLYQLRARYYSPAQGRFVTRDPLDGRPEVPMSLHRYLYANADPVNHVDPTGQESLAELSLTQEIGSALDAANFYSKANTLCTVEQQFETIGYLYMLGTLGVTAFFETALLYSATDYNAKAYGKTAFTAFGINPTAVGAKQIKSIQIRLEVPFALKVSTTFKDTRIIDLSYGRNDLTVGAGLNQPLAKLSRCGVALGALNLKGRVKVTDNARKALSLSASISTELEILKVFRYEFPIWDGSVDTHLKRSKKWLGGLL